MNHGTEINQTTGSKYLNQYIPTNKIELESKPNTKHGLNSFPLVVQCKVLKIHSESIIPPPIKLYGSKLMM
jgi:hypothetical protein